MTMQRSGTQQPQSAAGQGPQSGVDYFSGAGTARGEANLNPGQSSLAEETPPAYAGLRENVPSQLTTGDHGPNASFGTPESNMAALTTLGQIALGGITGGAAPAIQGAMSLAGLTSSPLGGLQSLVGIGNNAPAISPIGGYGEVVGTMLDPAIADNEVVSIGVPQGDVTGTDIGGVGGVTGAGLGNAIGPPDSMDSVDTVSGDDSSPGGGSVSDGSVDGTGPGATGDDGAPAASDGAGVGADGGWADGGMIGQRNAGIIPRYADGGAVNGGAPLLAMGFNQGGPVRMGAQPDGQQIMGQVNQMLRDPRVVQQIMGNTQQLMASGELTPQEVLMMGRIAEAAALNPSLYPQLRAFVQQQGMSPLPPSFDPSAVTKIIAISRVLAQGAQGGAQPGQPGQPMQGQPMQPGGPGATPPGQVPPMSQAQVQAPVPGMANGGFIMGPGTGRSDSIGTVNESVQKPVKVANNEYIIPERVVRAKGREFFDNLLRRYSDVGAGE